MFIPERDESHDPYEYTTWLLAEAEAALRDATDPDQIDFLMHVIEDHTATLEILQTKKVAA